MEGVKRAATKFEFIQEPFVPEAISMAVKKTLGSVDAQACQVPEPGVLASKLCADVRRPITSVWPGVRPCGANAASPTSRYGALRSDRTA